MGLGFGLFGDKVVPLTALFGISSAYAETIQISPTVAGVNTLDGVAVATGKVLVVTNIVIRDQNSGATDIFAQINAQTSISNLFHIQTPTQGLYHDRQGWWPLGAGDQLRLRVHGATAGKNCDMRAVGFYMDV
jgi:hypothetical protein